MTRLNDDERIAEYSSGVTRLSLDVPSSSNDSQEEDQPRDDGSNDTGIPIELQLYQVDMNDPKMDPLEWAVRKIIPIPREYYWDTGSYELPLKTKLWHRTVGTLGAVVAFVERIGKPVTEATGLTASRFDYVKSTMSEKQLAKAQKTASERKLRNEASRRAVEVEEGGSPLFLTSLTTEISPPSVELRTET